MPGGKEFSSISTIFSLIRLITSGALEPGRWLIRIEAAGVPLFFEILMELKEFAVLSKIAPIHMEKKEYATPAIFNPANGAFSAGRYYGYPSTISFTERVFLLSNKGELRPYLEITEKEIDGMFHDRSIVKNKVLDEDLLKRFTTSYYSQLMTYASKNDLNIKEKDGLLSVLAYYKDINK